MIITIDGPAASGKSSVARALAKSLNFYYLNSGLLYRAVAYILDCYNFSIQEMQQISQDTLKIVLSEQKVTYCYNSIDQEYIIINNNQNIISFLKEPKIDMLASVVSVNQNVRHELLEYQRQVATKHNIVTDGRDTGSVVFPHADYKFYLTASLEIRARRWQQYQCSRGNIYTLEESLSELKRRDTRDRERDISPLVVPEGAQLIDNSLFNFEETLNIISGFISEF